MARSTLQGLLAGAGAAAQGQHATPAALGASASVVLNNLIESAYGETSSQLTLSEREARKDLVSSLISGTTHALSGEAALANAAATLETENNSTAAMTMGGMAVIEPISAAALIAGSAGAAAVAVVGGEIYLLKEDAQNSADADAILAGDWSLEQVIAHRGRRCAQAVELQVMSRQLHPHMTLAEKLYLQALLSKSVLV